MSIKKYPYSQLKKPGQSEKLFLEIKKRLANQD
jgi:hypothetical protein